MQQLHALRIHDFAVCSKSHVGRAVRIIAGQQNRYLGANSVSISLLSHDHNLSVRLEAQSDGFSG